MIGEPAGDNVEGSVVDELEGTMVDGDLEGTVEGVPVGITVAGDKMGELVTGVLESGALGTTVAGTTNKNKISISLGDDRRYGVSSPQTEHGRFRGGAGY